MPDARIAEILKALEPPKGRGLWYGGASPLGSLRGVAAKEAAWNHAANRHSIWELVLHLAYWKYAVRRRLTGEKRGGFPRAPADWPAMPQKRDDKGWKHDRALLRVDHDRLIDVIKTFDENRLDRRPGGKGEWTCADLLIGVVMHDTYHTGQIQLLKRLYRSA